MSLSLLPVTQEQAQSFMRRHRHSRVPRRFICAVGVAKEGGLVGVACLERPKAPALCDGYTVEISRVCTDGTFNACSMLYGAMRRVAAGLGYRRVVTYTLDVESGASVRASGFVRVADVNGEDWNRRRLAAQGHQPDMYEQKYGEPVDRVRWEWAA